MKKKIPTPKFNHLSADGNASKEAESFANEDLEKEARINEHQRKETFKNHFNKAALIIFWLIVVGFSVIAFIWVYHLLTPEKWHFLTSLQIDKLQTILISASTVKISQIYLNKHN